MAQSIAELSKSVTSLTQLKEVLEQHGIETYERNGILTGVWNTKRTRKYRLKNLGIDTLDLGKMISKEKERMRRLKRNRDTNRNRER